MKILFLQKWGSLVVMSLALAIIVIDTTLLNVSITNLIHDLKTDVEGIQWVITAYALILAALTITGGRLGDLYGKKKMFMLGAVLFAIGSFIASISHSLTMMIIGEAVIEGLGAALMMPATASLLVANFEGRERQIAFGVWGGIAAASSAIGPILGGFLTTHYTWRWGFRINIVVVALLLLGSVLIKEKIQEKKIQYLDFGGVLLSAFGLLSIVFGFIKSGTYGWLTERAPLEVFHHTFHFWDVSVTPFFILFGFLLLGIFVFYEQYIEYKGKTPLVSMKIFKNRMFTVGSLTTMFQTLGMSGLIFSIPIFLQTVKKLNAFDTGIAMLPLSLSMLVSAPASAVLSKKVGAKKLILAGLILTALAFFVLSLSLSSARSAWSLAPGYIIFGIGMGMVMAQISNLTLSAVSVSEAGEASGVNNTMRQVGMTLGSAILGAVLLSSITNNISGNIEKSSVFPQNLKPQIVKVLSESQSSIEFGGEVKVGADIPQHFQREIQTIVTESMVKANKLTLIYGAFFTLLGLITALFIPKKS
jgi:EmrB/QacA subfamily drug resistance transporter